MSSAATTPPPTPAYSTNELLRLKAPPLRVVPPVLFTAVTYFLVGLRGGSPDFAARFLLVLTLSNLSAVTIFFFVSVCCTRVSTANLVCTLVTLYNMLMCGALAQKISVPENLRWLFGGAVLNYAYEALMINEFVGVTFDLGVARAEVRGARPAVDILI